MTTTPQHSNPQIRVAGLFAGIGGIELGLSRAGLDCRLLCEIDPAAASVLETRFPDTPLVGDIFDLCTNGGLPEVDLVAAGFPCQDLSQAGRTGGIRGEKSGVVSAVFDLFDQASPPPTWLLFENVPFMLQLDRGKAMQYLTDQLEARGMRWAYRVIDTRAFGLPQRRQRVVLLASATGDPASVLFSQDAGAAPETAVDFGETDTDRACGFYWTEGRRGLGWTFDAIPTLKGGSTVGIPSPPAIVLPHGDRVVLPSIEDTEALQGFPRGWTTPADTGTRNGPRWKLVGNAVSVPLSEWVGNRLATASNGSDGPWDDGGDVPFDKYQAWPKAAYGDPEATWRADVSPYPEHRRRQHLYDLLDDPTALPPLSLRAASGFLDRFTTGSLKDRPYLRSVIEEQIEHMATSKLVEV